MSLEGKVVLITGAGLPNGIGAGIAGCFAAESAKVVITDLEGSRIDDTIASIAALGPSTILPAYGAAKAGVVHLTKTLALQLAPRGIRVNCICPGILWTRA